MRFRLFYCSPKSILHFSANCIIITVYYNPCAIHLKRNVKMKKKIIIAVCLAVVLIAAAAAVIFIRNKQSEPVTETIANVVSEVVEEKIIGEEGKVETVSEGTLREVLDLSQISTVDYTYNSIVKIPTEKKNKDFGYAVSYNGTIKAGIDFSKIDIDIDDEKKHITVSLPEAEITDITVDAGSLEYIFEDKKLNTETVASEAYSLACDDLKAKAAENHDILESAKENAHSAVEALLKPWIEQLGEYDIEIK